MFVDRVFPDLGTTIVVNFPLAAQSAVPSIAQRQMPAGARGCYLSDGIDAIVVQQGVFSVLLDDVREWQTSMRSLSRRPALDSRNLLFSKRSRYYTAVLPYRRC